MLQYRNADDFFSEEERISSFILCKKKGEGSVRLGEAIMFDTCLSRGSHIGSKQSKIRTKALNYLLVYSFLGLHHSLIYLVIGLLAHSLAHSHPCLWRKKII